MLPIFLDTSVFERNAPKPWKHSDAGNDTSLPVAPFSWQTGPFKSVLCVVAFSTHPEILQTLSAVAPRGGESWEQNVNSSAADKHGGRNPCCHASCPDLPTWFTSCSPLRRNRIHSNKGDLYLCQVNNVSASSWLLLTKGLRNKCACLQRSEAALSRSLTLQL